MNKQEYLGILSDRLRVLSVDEYENIMEYYTEYFEDAGEENEGKVIEELGDVEKLAERIIRENMGEDNQNRFNDAGYQTQNYNQQQYTTINGQPYANTAGDSNKGLSTGWKVAIAILTFPIWIGVAGALFGLVFGFGVGSVACFFAGIATVIAGFGTFASGIGTGLLFVGAGLIVVAVSIGLMLASVGVATGIKAIFNAIFKRDQQQQYV